ncbi:MAG: prepilin-type N-terminal cleavage/methylation domain-containing protein [Acidobacteria bacterium]|nr:prepilin-type N-terminal cleavage/methylation domain-containing protein [Acidobacteriota bacterium]
MSTRTNRSAGFTLLEITVVIAVLAILAAAITPMILQQIVETKIGSTRNEAKLLHEAIVGKPDVVGSYGFFGDLARYPKDFKELLKPSPGTFLFHTDTFRNVGMGWKGPYINVGDSKDDALVDAFGREYQGAQTGQVRSAGPDGVFETEDDIVYPPVPARPYGRLLVTVKRMAAEDISYTLDPPNYTVRLYYSENGEQMFVDDAFAPFVFENVPQGVHAVVVLRIKEGRLPQAVVQDTIQVFGGGATKLVELIFRL